MNLLDVLVLLAIASAVVTGVRIGFLARTASWLGVLVGIAVAAWTVPTALGILREGEPVLRLLVGVVVLAVTVAAVAAVFQSYGLRMRRRVLESPLSALDRGAGGIAGALAVLVLVWFLVPAAAEVPGTVARQVRGSAVAIAVTHYGPTPPDTVRALRNLVAASRFPEVIADLGPTPVTGPPPEQIPLDSAVVDRVIASTVNVETQGCDRRFEGSGFTVSPGIVVTNAHVVAGADSVQARRPDGVVVPATVVVFDAERDLALLHVPEIDQTPLELAPGEVGGLGVVIGYPGGQNTPRVAPSEIRERRTALGRDVYGGERTERRVLFLAADLQQGDSGSPLIDADGRVNGVVFAVSPDRATSAFALDVDELRVALDANWRPGEAGTCI